MVEYCNIKSAHSHNTNAQNMVKPVIKAQLPSSSFYTFVFKFVKHALSDEYAEPYIQVFQKKCS